MPEDKGKDVGQMSIEELRNELKETRVERDNYKVFAQKIHTVVGGIAEGNLTNRVEGDYTGEMLDIKNNVNATIDVLKSLMGEVDLLGKAAVDGLLDTRADAGKFNGDFAVIVNSMNGVLDATIGPLNVAAEYVDRVSKGDIPEMITDEYKGDFNEIKNNLNKLIESINLLVSDANTLSQAGIDGKLDTRADVSKHGGDFAQIVKGLNDTLDAVIGPLNVAAEYIDRVSPRATSLRWLLMTTRVTSMRLRTT